MTELRDKNTRVCLISIKESAIGITKWSEAESYLFDFFAKKNLELKLIVRIFGRDEVWVVTAYTTKEQIKSMHHEPLVKYTAVLTESISDGISIVRKIRRRKLPVVYMFIRTDPIALDKLKKIIQNSQGSPFLLGRVDHPKGYNYFAAFTNESGKISELNNTIHGIAEKIESEKWESWLGAEHWLPIVVEEKEKKEVERKEDEELKKILDDLVYNQFGGQVGG